MTSMLFKRKETNLKKKIIIIFSGGNNDKNSTKINIVL